MSADLNLLPSQAKFQAAKMRLKKRIMFFVWIFSGTWVALLLTVFVVLLIQQFNLKKVENNLKSEQDQYKSMSDDAVLSYQIKYQAKLVSKVLTDRFEYGSSIERINNIFSSNIIINNYKIKNFKKFILDAKTIRGKDMDEVEDTVKSINRGEMEGLASAKLNTVEIEPNGWRFSMEVDLK